MSTGQITASFAIGSVNGNGIATGGLVGLNQGTIMASYAMGPVTGHTTDGYAGGLVGQNSGGAIDDSFATGAVRSAAISNPIDLLGGLVAVNSTGTVSASYWDTNTTGQQSAIGSDSNNQSGNTTGLTTAQLQNALPNGFSNTVWGGGNGLYPYLLWQFPSGTPQSVSGYVSTSGYNGQTVVGQTVHVALGGTDVTALAAPSGANGYYYDLVAPGTIASDGSARVLAYSQGSGGAAVTDSAFGSVTGLNVYNNTLNSVNNVPTYSAAEAEVAAAIGGNSALQTIVSGLPSLVINTSDTSFTVDAAINSPTGYLAIIAPNGNIAFDAPVVTTTVDLNTVGPVTQNSAGTITASTLTGFSAGQVTLVDQNAIADLGNFSTDNAGFLLTTTGNLTLNGNLSVGTSFAEINSGGTLIERSAGAITGAAFGGTSQGTARLNGANAFTYLGGFTTGNGNFALTNAQAFQVSGTLSAGTGNVTLTTTGTGSDMALYGPVSGGTVDLVSSGNITQNLSGVITASMLTGSSIGQPTLQAQNAVADLSSFSTNGNGFLLTTTGNLTVNGLVNVGASYALLDAGGTLTESGAGAITGEAFGGSSQGTATLNGANAFTYLGGFTAGNGDFLLTNAAPLLVSGTLSANNVTLTTTGAGGNLALYAPVTASGGTVDLVSSGNITQNLSGVITASTFTGSSLAQTTLQAENAVGNLGPFSTNSTGFLLTTSGNLTLDGALNVGTSYALLNAGGTLSETGAGAIIGEAFGGTSQGTATLNGANSFTYLGGFAVQNGDFALTDAEPLLVTVALSANNVTLTTTGTGGNLAIYAPLTASGGTVDLVSSGNITQNLSGIITASTLNGSSIAQTTLQAQNAVGDLGPFSTNGNGFLLTTTGNLTVNGAVNVGASYALLDAGGTLSETGAGAITGEAFGGASQGTATLNGANAFTYLGGFTVQNGDFLLTNAAPLLVTGTLSANNVTLTTTGAGGNLAIYAPLTASGGTVDLVSSGNITQNLSGIITASTFTGSSTAQTILQAQNAIGDLDAFTTNGTGFQLITAGNLTVNGALNVGSSYASLFVGGTLGETGAGAVTANAFGGTSQGTATLNGANAFIYLGGFTTGNGNFALTDTQALDVTNTLNAGTGNVTLKTTNSGSNLAVYAAVDGSIVDLISSGNITQNPSGIITAATLTGSSVSQTTLVAQNAVADLGSFSTGNAGFLLTTTENLTLNGLLNVGSSFASLTVNGTLTESGAGAITGSAFGGSSRGAATLNGANAFTYLGGFTTGNGAFALTDAQSLQTSGTLNAGSGNVTFTTTGSGSNLALYGAVDGSTVDLISGGNISQNSAGIITATTLTGSSVSNTSLRAENVITNLGNFSTDNANFNLTDSIHLNQTGTISTGTGTVNIVDP